VAQVHVHAIGIPEKHDCVQTLLDPLCLLHVAELQVLVTSRAERGWWLDCCLWYHCH